MKHVKITSLTGISIVIANMIGTGAFTSLGFQLNGLSNTTSILSLWIIGGVFALAGAFSYAEVGTVIKRSGGEYAMLDSLYSPLVGYLSGWVSITVGFAAPIALSVIAFTQYFSWTIPYPKLVGILIIGLISWIHSRNLHSSSVFQNISTLFKVLIIIVFIIIALLLPGNGNNPVRLDSLFLNEISSAAFAVSLIYVTYSYSGWNAAAYITEGFENPKKSLPIALIGGTMIVTVLYTFLQYSFLKHVPQSELVNKVNIGTITATHMLGERFATVFSGSLSLLLVSGISAMIWVGPQVTAGIAKKYPLWNYFSVNKKGIPIKASMLQFALSSLLLLTGTFDQILIYCGVLLTLSSLLVVTGVFRIRMKSDKINTDYYRSPLFPYLQIIFIAISLWIITFALINNTQETLLGLLNLVVGGISYFISKKRF